MTFASIISRQARAIVVIVVLLCAAGLYAAWRLPISVFPQTDFPRIVIIVDNGEAPASQTLVSVTRPILVGDRSPAQSGAAAVAFKSPEKCSHECRLKLLELVTHRNCLTLHCQAFRRSKN